MKATDTINHMSYTELFNKSLEWGFYEAAILLESKTNKGAIRELYIYDRDDEAYNTGLAQLLQDHTTWINCVSKPAFKAYLKKEQL